MIDRFYRTALISWPTDYRSAHGDELIDTVLEMSEGRASVRQWVSLLINGLGARELAATSDDARLIWDGAVRVGFLLFFASVLAEMLHGAVSGYPEYAAATWPQAFASVVTLSAIAIIFFLVLRARAMAMILTVLVAVSWFWGPAGMPRLELAAYSVAALSAAWWLARNNRRTKPGVITALLCWVAMVVAVATIVGEYFPAHDALVLTLSFLGVAVAKADPRLLIGTGIYWSMRLLISLPSQLDSNEFNGWGTLGSMPTLQLTVLGSLVVGCLLVGGHGVSRRTRN